MKMRDGPNRMTKNLEKQIIELSKLMEGDPRISSHLMEVPVSKDIMSSSKSQCKGTQADIPKVHQKQWPLQKE